MDFAWAFQGSGFVFRVRVGRVGRDGLRSAREAPGARRADPRCHVQSLALAPVETANRTSLYQEITDKIITELEAGRVPSVQLWGTVAAKASLTRQRMRQRIATIGINVLIRRSQRARVQHPELAHFPSGPWASGAMFARVSMARQFSMLTTLSPMRNVSEPCAMKTNPGRSGSSNDLQCSTLINAKTYLGRW
jgi:hypothetical protein